MGSVLRLVGPVSVLCLGEAESLSNSFCPCVAARGLKRSGVRFQLAPWEVLLVESYQ